MSLNNHEVVKITGIDDRYKVKTLNGSTSWKQTAIRLQGKINDLKKELKESRNEMYGELKKVRDEMYKVGREDDVNRKLIKRLAFGMYDKSIPLDELIGLYKEFIERSFDEACGYEIAWEEYWLKDIIDSKKECEWKIDEGNIINDISLPVDIYRPEQAEKLFLDASRILQELARALLEKHGL